MKRAALLITGLIFGWTAYSLAPDFWRYMKIRAM
jgi:hypothetical protein